MARLSGLGVLARILRCQRNHRAIITAYRQYYKTNKRSSAPSTNSQDEMFPQRLTLPEDYGYVPMLSPAQATAILSISETTAPIQSVGEKKSFIRSFDSNQLGSNSPVEDRRAIGKLTQSGGELFAVIDGHGGGACAQAVTERLLDYIAASLLPFDKLEEYSRRARTVDPVSLVDYYHFRESYASEDLTDTFQQSLQRELQAPLRSLFLAMYRYVVELLSSSGLGDDADVPHTAAEHLKSAFTRLDADISTEAAPVDGKYDDDLLQIALSGACACSVLVDGKTVHVANVGDCRAVLGSVDPQTGRWLARPLSKDHNVDSEAEAARVRDAHPRSEAGNLFKNARLLGQLIPLRAFGDVRFKWSVKDLKQLATALGGRTGQSLLPSHYVTPPYLDAHPEVLDFKLSKSDRFIIIASDGLWEMMSNEKAVEIVGDHLIGMTFRDKFVRESYGALTLGEINNVLLDRRRGKAYRSADVNGATHLVRHALGFDHRKVSEMLTLPAGMSRFYRDDITIIVIYLDADALSQEDDSQ